MVNTMCAMMLPLAALSLVMGIVQQAPNIVPVPTFAVVTSTETTRRYFGDGLPAAYDYQVPPIPRLLQEHLAAGQTLGFLDADEIDTAAVQGSAASMLEPYKIVALVETAGLSDAAGAALLLFARGGGAVIVVGDALASDAKGVSVPGGFATPLGRALGLRRTAGPLAGAAVVTSRNISTGANPEWWRLLATSGSNSTELDGAVGPGIIINAVSPATTEGASRALVLATATLSHGTTLPLLTATRVGQRGWLVYCSTTADSQLVRQAVNFVLRATGVSDPYAGNPWSPMGIKVSGDDGHGEAGATTDPSSIAGLPSTAFLSYAPPVDTRLSLEGRFRVTLIGAVANSTTCVTFMDRWWGDSAPSHTVTNTSGPNDFTAVTAQVGYAGAIACATVSSNYTTKRPPWFELRTTASGRLHGFCETPATQLAEECELNGWCSTSLSSASSAGGDCVCTAGWMGPTCGTLDLLPAPRQGVWPHQRPNASGPESASRTYEPVSWGFTAVRDASTGKYHGFVDTGCYKTGDTDEGEQYSHMTDYQTTHVVGSSPLGPFVGVGIAAPPTHYNPHAYHFDDGSTTGLYVLYTNGGALRQDTARVRRQLERERRSSAAVGTCNGMEENHTHHPLPFTMPAGNCTTALCAIYATSPHGPWKMHSVDSPCTDNAVPYQLKNGSILLAGTCGSINGSPIPRSLLPGSSLGSNTEKIQLLIAAPGNFFGPFRANSRSLWMEDEPGEDPTIFEDSAGNIHMLFHGYLWHGLWTGVHAYSNDGGNSFALSRRRDGRSAFSTNLTYEDGGWETLYRRERPELRLGNDGNPSVFYSGVQYAQDRPHKQYSYTVAHRVRGGNGGIKTDDNT